MAPQPTKPLLTPIVAPPTPTVSPSSLPSPSAAPLIADTGCSAHYIQVTGPVTDIQPACNPISVVLPDGTTMISTHTASLPIPSLPYAARSCHLFPSLATGSLLSIGQLCDHGCTALFTATHLHIALAGQPLLEGYRSGPYGHWIVHLQPHVPGTTPSPLPAPPVTPSDHMALALLPTSLLTAKIAFYHAAMFSPTWSTWCAAIDAGHLATWPDLTSAQIRRHFQGSVPMYLGHLDQTRANQRSTKPSPPPETDPDTRPEPTPDRSHAVFVDVHHVTGALASDQTGRFLVPSSAGHQYHMVLYEYDSNYIHAIPLRSRTGPDILAAFQSGHQLLLSRGLKPQLHRLDNEASTSLLQYLSENHIDAQLTPPYVHRRNG